MASDVRAAAEEALSLAEDICLSRPALPCKFENLVCEVCEAYLSEHPADDEEPITEEWLAAIGGKKQLTGDYSFFSERKRPLREEEILWVDIKADGFVSLAVVGETGNSRAWYLTKKTRKEVRSFLSALGIELKEGTDGQTQGT